MIRQSFGVLQGINLPAQRIIKMPLMQIWLQHLESWRCTSFPLCSLLSQQRVGIPGLLNRERSLRLTEWEGTTLWLGDRISLAHSHTLYIWKVLCTLLSLVWKHSLQCPAHPQSGSNTVPAYSNSSARHQKLSKILLFQMEFTNSWRASWPSRCN